MRDIVVTNGASETVVLGDVGKTVGPRKPFGACNRTGTLGNRGWLTTFSPSNVLYETGSPKRKTHRYRCSLWWTQRANQH